MTFVKPSDSVTVQFTVTDPTTGAATDADSLPVGTLIRNGANTGETVTVQNVTVGVYSAAVTIPAGYAAGDEVQLRIAATVGGVAGEGIVWSAQVDTKLVSDLNDFDSTNDNVTIGDIIAAALAKFATVDSGETSAVAGSIAKIAQGAAGLTVGDIWGHDTRTLTQGAAEVASAVEGSVLNIVPTVTFSATISGLSIPSNWDKIYLTVKKNKGDVDSEALLQIVVTNGGDPDDGIVILDKTAIADSDAAADDGVLTIDQGAGTIDIDINDEATAELLAYAGNAVRHYDIKALRADDESELLTESTLVFGAVVTRAHTA